MAGMKTKLATRKGAVNNDMCCFCGCRVNLDDEGVTYENGKCAHESCHDGNEFNKANASDFRD